MATFDEFKTDYSSEKVILARINAARRLQGWVVHSGNVYKITSFSNNVLVSMSEDGVALTSVATLAAVTAGDFFHDRTAQTIYMEASDSADPNGKFIALIFSEFFSNNGVKIANDLSTGFAVWWRPLISKTSAFGQGIDNENQFGLALEGSGSINFHNDKDYWQSRFDRFTWENKAVSIYVWNQTVPVTSAKLIYKGKVKSKSYTDKTVGFQLKDLISELRANVSLSDLSAVSGALLDTQFDDALQRTVYGFVNGLVPSPLDQITDDGYLLTGTVAITNATTTLTGTSTTFLNDYKLGDEISIEDVDDFVTIESIATDISLEVSEAFSGATVTGKTHKVVPAVKNKRYANRVWLIAGHAIREPSTTITVSFSDTKFQVADVSEFFVGDSIVVNSESRTISNVTGDVITITQSLSTLPNVSDTVTKNSVSNVFIDSDQLQDGRDFTIDAANGKITLDEEAEVNISPVKTPSGSFTFTNGDPSVSATNGLFTSEIAPGDWIKDQGKTVYFEVLSIESDTDLTLTADSSYTAGGKANLKTPKYFIEGESVLTCDTVGKTDDGLKSGVFLGTAPAIVEDLLKTAGLTADINTSSFTTAKATIPQKVGMVIPDQVASGTTRKFRDIISDLNQSVFGTLKQDQDFLFAYESLEVNRDTDLSVNEADILKYSVKARSDKIAKTTVIEYDLREYDPVSREEKFTEATHSSELAEFLVNTEEEFRLTSRLIDATEADTLAERFSLVLALSSSVLSFTTKLQAIDLDVNDKIEFKHQAFYHRFGSTDPRKVAAIQKIKKSETEVSVQIEDLGNAFSRCSTMTENTADDFSVASESEKSKNGYMTDEFGLIGNDGTVSETNLIF